MRTTILLLFFWVPTIIYGQQTTEVKKDSVDMLEPVIVSATRQVTKGYVLPFSYSTIDAKNIHQKGSRTTPEALSGTTGVFIQKTNHGGGSAFIRGLTGNQTLILLDGIRLNNATFRYGPNQYLNTVDLYTIDKIEVIKGSGSVQYGSDALGGVIQLFSRDLSFQKKSFHATADVKAVSSNMEYTGRGEISYQSESFVFSGGYTNRTFGDLYGGDTTGRQSPSGYSEQAFDAKAKFRLGKQTTVSMAHQYVQQRSVPLYHRIKLENYAYYDFAPQERSMSYLKLENTSTQLWRQTINFVLSSQQSFERRNYFRNGNANRFSEEDKVKTFGATFDMASVWSKQWLSNSGIEYYHDRVNSVKYQIPISGGAANTQTLRGLYPDGATNHNFSVYSLHHINLGVFTIEAGVRYNALSIQITDTSKATTSLGKVNLKPASLVSNLALGVQLNQQSRVYTTFSTGYRSPNIDDMGTLGLVDFRYEVPAYDLSPEKSYHTEIGYRFKNKQLAITTSLYYMHLSNLITRVQVQGQQVNGYNVYTKQNSQESYVKGAEFDLTYQPTDAFVFHLGAAHVFGQNLSANEPMRRIPPFNGSMQIRYQHRGWYLMLEDVFANTQNRLAQGDKDDNRIPVGGTPGWNLVNVYGGYASKFYSIRTGLQNLQNTDYRTHGSGINGMGRSIWLSFTVKI